MTVLNLLGLTFERWTVIERTNNDKRGRSRWICKCACGTLKEISGTTLTAGISKSCGCYARDLASIRSSTVGGLSRNRTYVAWYNMIRRCTVESGKSKGVKNYFQRGITVCDEWLSSFENFFQDMGECPEGLSLDRIDNDGNYNQLNCRWATRDQQQNNKTTTLFLEFKGEKKSLTDWAKEINISQKTLWNRIDRGWSVQDALTLSVVQKGKSR